ncbi:MAG: NACHT domain-containing protein [Pleurocapsa sp.]
MAHISKRSLKASQDGVQLASRAILRFPTKIDFAAELEISRSTVQNFFAGKPVGRENFHKICQELDLSWQEVAELPQSPKLTLVNHQPESVLSRELVAEPQELAVDSVEVVVTEFRMQVQSRILSMCGTMRVLDMSCPMYLEDIYVDTEVYEKITGRRRLEAESICLSCFERKILPRDWESPQKKISGLSAARRYDKLIVLGKPGSGKTMFLKSLALQCSRGEFEPERIPIFVPLRDFVAYDSSLSLVNYITKQLVKNCQSPEINQVRQLLNQGKFFIIIDGLDEVKMSVRQDIGKHLRRFTEWFPGNRYLISCRHGVQYCNFEQFTEVEIADFKEAQIADFATKWFSTKERRKSIDFLEKLDQNSLIQEFSSNPLLLTLLCILFAESADFPSRRSEIYEEALDIMLRQWDAERSIERDTDNSLSLQQEKELLCAMALRTFEHKQHFFKEAELKFCIANYAIALDDAYIPKINAQKVLKSLEAKYGLIVEQAKKVYSFSHLAFQEYLTARKFVFEYDLSVSSAMLNHLVKYMTDERWREIFVLVAEMSPQADKLLQIMSQQISSQLAQADDLKILLDWVNCKAQSVETLRVDGITTSSYSQPTQFQPATIRAFYFSLGLSKILGCIGSNFDLALRLEPNFSSEISSNLDLVLDLSLFHISNLTHNIESIQCPALTFQRTLNRAIAHATQIQPELARELQQLARQLPVLEDNITQFWRWWHNQGKAWSNSFNSVAAQYRNMGYQWQFDVKQQKSLEQYYQANVLLLDCLNNSPSLNWEVREKIIHQLLAATEVKPAESQEIESMLIASLS